tara:strand:+ start:365 stop:487 length:123 start_codon:yes stop_codon:yes gene_type:complete
VAVLTIVVALVLVQQIVVLEAEVQEKAQQPQELAVQELLY